MKRPVAVAVLGAILGAFVWPAEAAIPSTRSGRRWALIVSTGAAPKGHAAALARVLSESYGFSGDALLVVNEPEATGENIQRAMSTIRARLQPYDSLFVYLSLDQRPDPSGGFSFVPSGAGASEAWSWIPARVVFIDWLSALPVGSALVVYSTCPSKFDEYLASELAYGKRPGTVELMRVCELSNVKQAAGARSSMEQWRARLAAKMVEVMEQRTERRTPFPTSELAARLGRALEDASVDVRRVPEYVTEGFVFEPATRGVAGERARFRAATTNPDRESALRNIPGILKSASDSSRDAEAAATFLREVALSPTAGLEAPLEAPARLSLRSVAVEVLGDVRTDAARDALAAVVQEADTPWVRRAALTQLTRFTPPRPADLEAVRRAFADPDADVREAAVRSAVVLNDTAGLPALADRLRTEADTEVRVALIQALPALGTRDRALLLPLLSDTNAAIRGEAAAALGRLGPNPEVTSALVARLREDQSDDVRRQAALALARTWAKGRPDAVYATVSPALLDALTRGPGPVREAAAYALGRTDGPQAEDALRDLLRRGGTEAERVAAAEALGELASTAAIADLTAAIRDADRPGLRRAAAAALGAIGTPAATALLVTALDDRDPFVQRQAQQSLEKMPLAADALAGGLRNESPRVRLGAVRRIGQAPDPTMVAPLIDVLDDPVLEVRQAAIAALAAYRDRGSIDRLVRATRAENRRTQFGVLAALASIPDVAAVQAVVSLAQDSPDVALRLEALGALRQQVEWLRRTIASGSSANPPGLDQALTAATGAASRAAKDESAAVRKAATPVLGVLPDGRARLEELAKGDASQEVRAAAIEQLRRPILQRRE